jgi:hypothetical protein
VSLERSTGAGPTLRLTATHLLPGVSSSSAGDALAVVTGGSGASLGPAGVLFVPSPLPCGECPYCRRALVSACRNLRAPLTVENWRDVEVPERFVTGLTEPGWADLPPPAAAGAGLVAEILDATSRSGLGPGDTAIWVGEEPWVSLGAAFSARRSCRTFRVSPNAPSPGAASEPVATLDIDTDATGWQAAVADAEAASGAGPGRPERRIFVYGAPFADTALRLAVPGTTVSFRRGVPGTLNGLDRIGALRVLVGGGYHPDLVPEALALLARGELAVLEAIREVPPQGLEEALTSFAAGSDRRFPVVRLAW